MRGINPKSGQSAVESAQRPEGTALRLTNPPLQSRGVDKENDLSGPRIGQLLAWLAMMAGAIVLFLNKFQLFQVGVYRDDASYVVLARSLVQAERYGLINAPGEPAATNFPFGFPLLLAPGVLLFPENLDALKAISLLATLVNGSLLFWGWRYFSSGKSQWWGLAVSAAYLFSPLAVSHAGMVMSEPAFTTFCLVALMFASRLRGTWWWSLGISAALAAALLVKTVGVVLILVVFFHLLLKEGRRAGGKIARIVLQMGLLIGVATALTPVEWQQLLPVEYLRSSNAAFLRVPMNIVFGSSGDEAASPEPAPPAETAEEDYDLGTPSVAEMLRYGVKWHLGRDVPNLVLPVGNDRVQRYADSLGVPFAVPVGRALVSALVFLGFVRWFLREKLSVFALFGAIYLASLFLWTWDGLRLLYPIEPQLQFGLLLGLEAVVGIAARLPISWGLSRRGHGYLLSAMVVALVGLSGYQSLRIDDSRLHTGDLTARTAWLSANVPATAVFATEQPAADFLYSKRRTVPYPSLGPDQSTLRQYLSSRGAEFVLVAPAVRWSDGGYQPVYSEAAKNMLLALAPLASDGRAALVHSSPDNTIRIYEVR